MLENLNEPHYVIGIDQGPGPQWRQIHATKAEAESWIAGYPVSQSYKDAHYRVVSVREYWERQNTGKRRIYAL